MPEYRTNEDQQNKIYARYLEFCNLKWVHIEHLPDNMFCDTYNQIHSLFNKINVLNQNYDTKDIVKYKEKWVLKKSE